MIEGLRIYELQTFHRIYDIGAEDRASALALHAALYPNEVAVDCKDKTAKRLHELENA